MIVNIALGDFPTGSCQKNVNYKCMTWNLISKEGSNHTVTIAHIKWHVGILTHACCNVCKHLPTERKERIRICRVSWTYNMCWKVRRNCCHFPSSRGDRPSRLWQDGWYVKLGPHNQATKYLATTNNNSSCSKLIYQIDLVCSLADRTKKSLLHPLTFTHTK